MADKVDDKAKFKRRFRLVLLIAAGTAALAVASWFTVRLLAPDSARLPAVNIDTPSGFSRNAPDAASRLLSEVELAYLEKLGPVYFCCDPDWEPYEKLDAEGRYTGIAADLVRLIAERSGVDLRLLPTRDWSASLEASRRGDCLALAFLNRTPEREQWLTFTEPYFEDPTVIIAREEHDYVSDLSRLDGAIVALPQGTSMEERIRLDYPGLTILLTDSERSALDAVSGRRADLTLRSLSVAAYTIRKEGYFNLKIAGQLADYDNSFRMGVSRDQPLLRDILNRGIRTITPLDVQRAINDHISIVAQTGFDYRLLRRILLVAVLLGAAAASWYRYLQRYNNHLRLIIDSMPAYVFAKDSKGRYILANSSTAAFYGLAPKEMLGKTDAELQQDSGSVSEYEKQDRAVMESGQPLFIGKHPGTRFDRSPGWFQTTKVPYRRPGTKEMALLGVTVDITELKNTESQLEESEKRYRHLAHHDQLTGLPNRALFFDRLEQAVALCRREHTGLALLFIDLDRFKEVNDTLGHDAGDQLLRESASRMNSCLRASDCVGRIGGDEFVVFLRGIADGRSAEHAAEKLRVAIEAPFMLANSVARVSASIGIALFPEHASAGGELAQRADAAMYRSKSNGRNRVSVYDPALDQLKVPDARCPPIKADEG